MCMRGFGSGLLEEGAARELVDTLDAVRQVLRAHTGCQHRPPDAVDRQQHMRSMLTACGREGALMRARCCGVNPRPPHGTRLAMGA